MRYLVLTSVLLIAIGADAQSSPAPTAKSGRCYSIVTLHVKPTEHLTPDQTMMPTITTCTPANHFRAKYIPNPMLHLDVVPARCPGCTAAFPDEQAILDAPNSLRKDEQATPPLDTTKH